MVDTTGHLHIILGNQDINANLEIWNFLSKFNMDGLINCNVTNILEVENSNNKKLIGFFDLNGKKLNKKINSIAIKIFEDGSVEKNIISKYQLEILFTKNPLK